MQNGVTSSGRIVRPIRMQRRCATANSSFVHNRRKRSSNVAGGEGAVGVWCWVTMTMTQGAVLQAEELYRAPTAEQLVERKHEREQAARRASLVKVRTSQKSLGDIKRGLSEKVLFRKGSSRARGGEEWVKKMKREEVRCSCEKAYLLEERFMNNVRGGTKQAQARWNCVWFDETTVL